jgi:hypothetical protein
MPNPRQFIIIIIIIIIIVVVVIIIRDFCCKLRHCSCVTYSSLRICIFPQQGE